MVEVAITTIPVFRRDDLFLPVAKVEMISETCICVIVSSGLPRPIALQSITPVFEEGEIVYWMCD